MCRRRFSILIDIFVAVNESFIFTAQTSFGSFCLCPSPRPTSTLEVNIFEEKSETSSNLDITSILYSVIIIPHLHFFLPLRHLP
jgi:hypothetical protein